MFVDEIKAAVEMYEDDLTFIPDVLSLETGHLLSDSNVVEKEITDLMEMKRDLGQYVKTSIRNEKLAGAAAQWFQEYVVCSECVKKGLFWYASPSTYVCRKCLVYLRQYIY